MVMVARCLYEANDESEMEMLKFVWWCWWRWEDGSVGATHNKRGCATHVALLCFVCAIPMLDSFTLFLLKKRIT
jgi:hypothetical protein